MVATNTSIYIAIVQGLWGPHRMGIVPVGDTIDPNLLPSTCSGLSHQKGLESPVRTTAAPVNPIP